MKKQIAFALALAIGVSALAGCAKTETTKSGGGSDLSNLNTTGFPIVKEKINMTMMGINIPNVVDWNENKFFERMEEKTNIHFDCTPIPNQSAAEKISLAFASDDLPDVWFKMNFTQEDEVKYDAEGQLIPLQDLIDQYAPTIKAVIDGEYDLGGGEYTLPNGEKMYAPPGYGNIREAITLRNGNIVTLPQVRHQLNQEQFWLNKNWLQKLNLSEPKTTQDFYEIMKAFKEGDPNGNGQADEIPFSSCAEWSINTLKRFMSAWGIYFNDYDLFEDAGKVVYAPLTPEFKEAMIYFNKMYKEGLIDQEFFIQSVEQYMAKAAGDNNKLGAVNGYSAPVPPSRYKEYTAMTPISTSADVEGLHPATTGITPGTFAITKNNKYPEATIRWVDYLYTEEGSTLSGYGVENEDFAYNEDGSWDYLNYDPSDPTKTTGKVTIQLGVPGPGIFLTEFNAKVNNPDDQLLAVEVSKVNRHIRLPFPPLYYEESDSKRMKSLNVDLSGYVEQMMAKFIVGEMDIEENWATFESTLKGMGADELVSIAQKTYDFSK